MKRDLYAETANRNEAAKVPGLQRKVRKMGDLAAKFQSERDEALQLLEALLYCGHDCLDNDKTKDRVCVKRTGARELLARHGVSSSSGEGEK